MVLCELSHIQVYLYFNVYFRTKEQSTQHGWAALPPTTTYHTKQWPTLEQIYTGI